MRSLRLFLSCFVPLIGGFFAYAYTTTTCVARCKSALPYFLFSSTVTQTEPVRTCFTGRDSANFRKGEHAEFAIYFSRHISKIPGPFCIVFGWFCKCALYRPTAIEYIIVQTLHRSACILCPRGKALCLPLKRNKHSTPRISHLLFLCSPSTILRRIGAVVVYAVNGVSRSWGIAHICVKILKRITPAFTHNDAATAVVVVTGVIRVIAPRLYAFPRSVRLRPGSPVCFICSSCKFSHKTPATFGLSPGEAHAPYPRAITAVTYAAPERPMPPHFAISGCDKPSESLPSEILYLTAASCVMLLLGHGRNLLERLRLWLEPVGSVNCLSARRYYASAWGISQ